MIATGADHECGEPMVTDYPSHPPRCSVCRASRWWYIKPAQRTAA